MVNSQGRQAPGTGILAMIPRDRVRQAPKGRPNDTDHPEFCHPFGVHLAGSATRTSSGRTQTKEPRS